MKIHELARLSYLLVVVLCESNSSLYSKTATDPNKDMYVIHAMVYQVGILTNNTDGTSPNTTMGNQEALTVYRSNGSKFDLSDISDPLVTNVTAQSMVQVAPKETITGKHQVKPQIPWSALQHLASIPQVSNTKSEKLEAKLARRSTFNDKYFQEIPQRENYFDSPNESYNIFKRESAQNKTTVKIVKGSALIPSALGVQSVAIPPLLALNNNLSAIPVPIPNTSVVQYAKINTLFRKPLN